jgi:anti-sigma-K factor RskA
MAPEQRPRRAGPRVPRQTPVPTEPDLPLDIDVHSLTGAYSVDALDDLERARFEQHLSTCGDCVAEVRSFTETTARLGGVESIAPPPGLRDAVLAEIARTRQLPPGPVPRRDSGTGGGSRSRWFAVAAASLLVAAAGLGGVALDAQRDTERLEETTAALTGVLADPDRQVMDADFAGGHATVMVSGEEVVLVGSGVDAPPSDAVYVLWMLDAAGSPRPAGVLEPAGDGSLIAHTTGYQPGETMAVTVEEDPETTLPHGDVVMTTA